MYPTTTQYDNSIYAPARTITGRVTFVIVDVTAAGDILSITTSTESTISNKSQLSNNVRSTTYNLATLETDRFLLDGSFSFPDDTIVNNGEMGYVSDILCDSAGTFSPSIDIVFVFNGPHSSVGITITFDVFNDEYAEDFTVTAYDASDVVIETVTVVGNTESIVSALGQLADYKKITIEITKWNVGDRRARIVEVDFGIIQVYTDDSLIRFGLIEEMNPISATLPSPEFDFTVDNSEKLFNILNPVGFYAYLQERQPIYAELGVDIGAGVIEWVPVGEYLLSEWTSDQGSLTASFTARTNLDVLANFDYEQLTTVSRSLKALAVAVFAICGITNYDIDIALDSITTNSLAKKTNCKNVLQMIAIAGIANIFVTRDNVITLKQIPTPLGVADDVIDFDNIYQEPKIVLEPPVKQVEVTYWTDLSTSAIDTVTSGETLGDVLKLEGNTLINTSARATAVANWILAQKAYRAKYQINWRGNPAHELGDVIDIENSFGSDMSAFITKRNMTYQGYLQGQTEAHGAVN